MNVLSRFTYVAATDDAASSIDAVCITASCLNAILSQLEALMMADLNGALYIAGMIRLGL